MKNKNQKYPRAPSYSGGAHHYGRTPSLSLSRKHLCVYSTWRPDPHWANHSRGLTVSPPPGRMPWKARRDSCSEGAQRPGGTRGSRTRRRMSFTSTRKGQMPELAQRSVPYGSGCGDDVGDEARGRVDVTQHTVRTPTGLSRAPSCLGVSLLLFPQAGTLFHQPLTGWFLFTPQEDAHRPRPLSELPWPLFLNASSPRGSSLSCELRLVPPQDCPHLASPGVCVYLVSASAASWKPQESRALPILLITLAPNVTSPLAGCEMFAP